MDFLFSNDLPSEFVGDTILISGEASLAYHGRAFLAAVDGVQISKVFEIRYEYSCSPFRQAIISDSILSVGFEGYFYLYDLVRNAPLLQLELRGYFGHLYLHGGHFYVAGASDVHRIDTHGHILWQSPHLAEDGVLIDDFKDAYIDGRADIDPPGTWVPFRLDILTGRLVKEIQ